MNAMDDTTDTEYLKEIRELLRFLLEPKSLEEEVSGIQDRGLGSRRKRIQPRTGLLSVAR
jgi:hypothetical protein